MTSKAGEQQVRKRGFCYVADCDGYIDEVMVSIASLRSHMPDVPVAIVTRRELFRDDPAVTDWVEMKQTRKGNTWHFGMKVHVGTDLRGLVHSVTTTHAAESDLSQLPQLLHGAERAVYGDRACPSRAWKRR